MLEAFFDDYASRYASFKPGRIWCYEDGCVYRGLLELHRITGEARWRDHLERLIAEQIDKTGTLLGYAREDFNIDNILSGRVLFTLTQAPGDRFDKALDTLADQLAHHPRTSSGNYWHKKIYPYQVWLDGLYMGLPFEIEYGLTHDRSDLVADAVTQMLHATEVMRDAETGLYFHGYDDSRAESWANAETGLSASFWGRANGWLSMALIDSYALLPAEHAAAPELARRILALADAILVQRTANGLWLQVMVQPELAGNYEETSCSSMFAYFLLKSARLVPGGERLGTAGEKALDALIELHVRQNGTEPSLHGYIGSSGE